MKFWISLWFEGNRINSKIKASDDRNVSLWTAYPLYVRYDIQLIRASERHICFQTTGIIIISLNREEVTTGEEARGTSSDNEPNYQYGDDVAGLEGVVFATLGLMKIEIDQSGKIEDTQHDTVLALANGASKSVRITGKTKRRLQEVYRQIGEPRLFVLNTFCVAIFLLVEKDLKKLSEIVIDEEYSGHERLIEGVLRKMIGEQYYPNIVFERVGKSSPAHIQAVETFRGKRKANETLTFEKIYRKSFRIENGRPTLKYHLPFG